MADLALTPEQLKTASDEANKYFAEANDLAKQNGIDTNIAGNDPGELLKASGAAMATGASVGAALGTAFPVIGTAIGTAVGALIGLIAGFFSKFHFGPTPEQKALAAEYDKFNLGFHEILLTVPQPYRAQLVALVLAKLAKSPGPFPFCLGGEDDAIKGEGGCVSTSIQGLRDVAQGLQQQVKDWIAKANAPKAGFGTAALLLGGAAFVGVVAFVASKLRSKPAVSTKTRSG